MKADIFLGKTDVFDSILYKTLSANDYKWANQENIHQAGVLVTKDLKEFFPVVDYSEPIFTKDIITYWPEEGRWIKYNSKWKHYESKTEYRITTVSKLSFKKLNPGSLLLIGRNGEEYYCYICNSEDSDEYEYVINWLELRDSPKWGILKKEKGGYADIDTRLDSLLVLPENITHFPQIRDLSKLSEDLFEKINFSEVSRLKLSSPGDYIEKTIDLEYKIYKKYESEIYSTILATKSEPEIYQIENLPENKYFYKNRLDAFSSVFLSMLQTRKSRVGITFELHVKSFFDNVGIKYDYQKKVDGKKKPDFILPSRDYYNIPTRNKDDAVLLSLKTSVKERWQQILNEGNQVKTRYLTTLDKKVTSDQIIEMADRDVVLVVTEWAKKNTESYRDAGNVISFKSFVDEMDMRSKNIWLEV